jgi:CubicO group peptidase (beta-lactamase class C family)
VPTLRQLLSHTGGFLALGAGDAWRTLVYGPATMAGSVRAIVEAGLDYVPGTGYAYTQLGYVVAAHAAERVMGKPFEMLFQEWLARPLGLASATFHPSAETIAAMPVRYARTPAGLRPLPIREYRALGLPIDPAASLVANMQDVARLFTLHLHEGSVDDRRLAQSETIRAMHVPQSGAPGYGFGLNIDWDPTREGARAIRHGGAFGTIAWADLEREIVGVMFTQTAWRQVPEWRQLFYEALDEVGLGEAARAGRGNNAGQ